MRAWVLSIFIATAAYCDHSGKPRETAQGQDITLRTIRDLDAYCGATYLPHTSNDELLGAAVAPSPEKIYLRYDSNLAETIYVSTDSKGKIIPFPLSISSTFKCSMVGIADESRLCSFTKDGNPPYAVIPATDPRAAKGQQLIRKTPSVKAYWERDPANPYRWEVVKETALTPTPNLPYPYVPPNYSITFPNVYPVGPVIPAPVLPPPKPKPIVKPRTQPNLDEEDDDDPPPRQRPRPLPNPINPNRCKPNT